jgi:hypothetical protein
MAFRQKHRFREATRKKLLEKHTEEEVQRMESKLKGLGGPMSGYELLCWGIVLFHCLGFIGVSLLYATQRTGVLRDRAIYRAIVCACFTGFVLISAIGRWLALRMQ